MPDYVQVVRCRSCGKTTEALKEEDEQGGSRIVAPPFCPTCGQGLVFDVLGPLVEDETPPIIREPDTSEQDTPAFPQLARDIEAEPSAVPVLHITKAAYGEAHTGGLDLRTVTPTGANGVIVLGDVIDGLTKQVEEAFG